MESERPLLRYPSETEDASAGLCSAPHARNVRGQVNGHRVPQQACRVSRGHALTVQQRRHRAPDVMEPRRGDVGLKAQAREPVGERLRPDGTPESVDQHIATVLIRAACCEPVGCLSGLQRPQQRHGARVHRLDGDRTPPRGRLRVIRRGALPVERDPASLDRDHAPIEVDR